MTEQKRMLDPVYDRCKKEHPDLFARGKTEADAVIAALDPGGTRFSRGDSTDLSWALNRCMEALTKSRTAKLLTGSDAEPFYAALNGRIDLFLKCRGKMYEKLLADSTTLQDMAEHIRQTIQQTAIKRN